MWDEEGEVEKGNEGCRRRRLGDREEVEYNIGGEGKESYKHSQGLVLGGFRMKHGTGCGG